jgi:DNA-binding GntR family transcriptional regulator
LDLTRVCYKSESCTCPSSSEKAYDYIKSAVMLGELKAGDRVKEEEIAERLGLSRTPIRPALQMLAAQGFIQMLHHQGARVVDWSNQDLAEITDLRALLEGFGARIAARKITPAQIEELKQLVTEMEAAAQRGSAADLEAITELNSQFHMTIIQASGNRRLGEVIGNLAHPSLPTLVLPPASNDDRVSVWACRFEGSDKNAPIHPFEPANRGSHVNHGQFIGGRACAFVYPDAIAQRQDSAVLCLHFVKRVQRFKAALVDKLPVRPAWQNVARQTINAGASKEFTS